MTKMTRRQLLWGGAMALAASAVPWWKLAVAQEGARRRNLIVLFVAGGWDTTAGIDPKAALRTIDSAPGDIKFFGDLSVVTGADRPAVEDFFSAYGSITSLVRGVQVRSIAHEECTRRIFTGTNSDANPDMGIIAGVELGADLAVPYMVLGDSAFSGPFGGSMGRAGTTGQLVTLLNNRRAYPAPGNVTARFSPDEAEAAMIHDYLKARAQEDLKERAAHGLNKRQLEDFVTSIDRSERLRPLVSRFGEQTFQQDFQPQIDLAVRLLSEGISNAIQIQHPGNWDTHNDNHVQQIALHQDLFAGLRSLADQLDAANLLEDTTVAVISEMSRTPKLNGSAGKDHWPVTSAMVFGGPVQGGRVIGATDDFFQSDPGDGPPITSASLVSGVLNTLNVDAKAYFPQTEALDL